MKSKVKRNICETNDIYTDGDVESEILKIFKNKDPKNNIEKILSNDPSWPMRYHLSPTRENLLNWYDFKQEASILEIGAGCGAITGVLANKLKKVVAVELSKLRSEIINFRYKNKKNLTVLTGNLNDIRFNEKFDYITLIGVLEYAKKYTHTASPFIDFLLKVKSFLKKNGTLIIAIENKFGLKYWAGCREDHTGKFFDSIEDYPQNKEIQTLSKYEIKKLLRTIGFTKLNFYYPIPDYKLPIEIFSDQYLPTLNHNIRMNVFPFQDYSQGREYIFNEKLAMDNIVKNQYFDIFANSFLIFAQF